MTAYAAYSQSVTNNTDGQNIDCSLVFAGGVISSPHQSPSLRDSRVRSTQTIAIILTVWSATKGSRKGGGCHEANDRSGGNGCALLGRFCSCADQEFGCDRCGVVPA